eukprot:TRINITY_DN9800_c0_g1_i1.p1 TRINITY_DN9800_c0_g1~~TRINITY_DN9800_c0_g1_i1.p1  ORF type:complete len:738 (+),score=189.19 TRINITY_DN9800_c0_g1_i1:303-2516(+)
MDSIEVNPPEHKEGASANAQDQEQEGIADGDVTAHSSVEFPASQGTDSLMDMASPSSTDHAKTGCRRASRSSRSSSKESVSFMIPEIETHSEELQESSREEASSSPNRRKSSKGRSSSNGSSRSPSKGSSKRSSSKGPSRSPSKGPSRSPSKSSSRSPSKGLSKKKCQTREIDASTASHSAMLREAAAQLAAAERLLLTLTCDAGQWCQERLQSIRQALEEDIAIASAASVEGRLQVLLQQHARANEDCANIEESCSKEEPEVLELRRHVADETRRVQHDSRQLEGGTHVSQEQQEQSEQHQTQKQKMDLEESKTVREQKRPKSISEDEEELRPAQSSPSITAGDELMSAVAGDAADGSATVGTPSRRSVTTSPPPSSRPASLTPTPQQHRLAMIRQAIEKRTMAAQEAQEFLKAEYEDLSATLEEKKRVMTTAIMEGRRLEDQQEEASEEVERACQAMNTLSMGGDDEEEQEAAAAAGKTLLQQAALAEERAERRPIAPLVLAAPSIAAGSGASLLDMNQYAKSREKAKAQAYQTFQKTRDQLNEELAQDREKNAKEEKRQEEEFQRFALEVSGLRNHLAKRRTDVATALSIQAEERDSLYAKAKQEMADELQKIEAREIAIQDVLRQEAIQAQIQQREAASLAESELELKLEQARSSCRRQIQIQAAGCENAVTKERQNADEAKQRKERLEKKTAFVKESLRGHTYKSGVYVRSLDANRRRQLEALVPILPALVT